MPIRVALAAALMVAATAPAALAKRLEVGQTGYLSSTALACPTLAGMRGVLKLADADFDAAVAKGANEGCKTFDKGTEVFVAEAGGALACIIDRKKRGSCMWTASDLVTPID